MRKKKRLGSGKGTPFGLKGYAPPPKKRKTTNKGTSWQCDEWNEDSISIDQASTGSSRDNSVMVDHLRWSIKFSKEREEVLVLSVLELSGTKGLVSLYRKDIF